MDLAKLLFYKNVVYLSESCEGKQLNYGLSGCHLNISSGYNLYDNSNYSQSTFSSIAHSKSTTLT